MMAKAWKFKKEVNEARPIINYLSNDSITS